jgi:hypothetical protein
MNMKGFVLAFMAAAMLAVTGCRPQGGTTQGKGIDTTGLQASLPMLIDEATAARLLGHKAAGMRYVLKIEDGGDTIVVKGTIGKESVGNK